MRTLVHPELLPMLDDRYARFRTGELDAATFAAVYFFHWQIACHGRAFAARRHRTDPRPDAQACLHGCNTLSGSVLRTHLLAELARYQFRGVRAEVPVALTAWLHGAWSLELRTDIPDAGAVLAMQGQGQRPVTVIVDTARLRQPVLTKPDAFAFFLHDLEHACKFFADPALHAAQRVFFARLQHALADGVFADWRGDAQFEEKFRYLMSDMNTHPEHSRQYLRAILIEAQLRREGRGPKAPLSRSAQQAVTRVLETLRTRESLEACA